MSLRRLRTHASEEARDHGSLLSPMAYDDDASSVHSRSDQDTDSDDDELQSRARNSRELLAADRIVLMEEEETDKLVADAWTKQERQRRGSGLAMPQSLKIFGRRPSMTRTKSTSSFVDDANSEKRGPRENVREKRDRRRVRRQHRKKRLMEDAQDGEDGELMYEMERGVIKDGSSTGESSDMEGSDDLDRRKLHVVTGQKTEKSRRWRRWLLIHLLIAIGFAILVLLAWKLSKARKSPSPQKNLKSNGTALFLPTTLLISLDGFRADFLQRGLTPTLNTLIKEGVSPKHMHPSFPSVTFPNHHTIATGLYPESHGIVGNTFWDPELETDFYYTDTTRSMDPKWWGGEPFWVTAEKQGVRTALHMWPGSEAHIMNTEPSYIDFYNHDELLDNKVASILGYLDRPGYEDASLEKDEMRPQLIAAYIGEVDANGHKYGPNSTEIKSTIESVDAMLAKIFHGLESRNLTDIVNVIVVSDHGMATTDKSRLVQLDDLVDMNQIERTEGWPSYGLRPKNEENLQQIYQGILEKTKGNPNVEVYLRDNGMPERYHFSNNPRIAPLWIVPKAGWAIVKKDEYVVAEIQDQDIEYTPRGIHGYDHEDPLMRAIFIARGPAFPHPPNSEVEVFQNIEVYNMLCDSVAIKPQSNNGTLRLPLKPIGIHHAEDIPKEPSDPPTHTIAATSEAVDATTIDVQGTTSRPVTETTTLAEAWRPTAPSTPLSVGNPDGGQSDEESLKHKLVGVWDWVKDKASGFWNKVTGDGG